MSTSAKTAILGRSLILLVVMTTVSGVQAQRKFAPFYEDKADLLVYFDAVGRKHSIHSHRSWTKRRAHILRNMQLVMGDLPSGRKRVGADVQVIEEAALPSFVRKKITFAPFEIKTLRINPRTRKIVETNLLEKPLRS